MYQRTNIRRGMAVMSYDGVQVGRVIDVNADGILIEKGQFFLRDFQVPFSDISVVRGEDLVLVRDHAALRLADTESSDVHTRDTVGIAGIAAPPAHGLGLGPTDLTRARMDSAKFQDHAQYDLRTFREGGEPLTPDPLTEARMDSAKFQDHGLYNVGTASAPAREETPIIPPPLREPAPMERRAAGPGWDPLSVDEEAEEKPAPRTSGPDTDPPTRY
jgi:hypothetical protein